LDARAAIDDGNTTQHYFVTKDKLSLFYDVSVLGGELRNTVNINILP